MGGQQGFDAVAERCIAAAGLVQVRSPSRGVGFAEGFAEDFFDLCGVDWHI